MPQKRRLKKKIKSPSIEEVSYLDIIEESEATYLGRPKPERKTTFSIEPGFPGLNVGVRILF